MPKAWTESEDEFLHAFADAMGADYIGPHDLGRSAKATIARVKFLKESGAWAAMDQVAAWRKRYRLATNRPCLGGWDCVDESRAVHLREVRNG